MPLHYGNFEKIYGLYKKLFSLHFTFSLFWCLMWALTKAPDLYLQNEMHFVLLQHNLDDWNIVLEML